MVRVETPGYGQRVHHAIETLYLQQRLGRRMSIHHRKPGAITASHPNRQEFCAMSVQVSNELENTCVRRIVLCEYQDRKTTPDDSQRTVS